MTRHMHARSKQQQQAAARDMHTHGMQARDMPHAHATCHLTACTHATCTRDSSSGSSKQQQAARSSKQQAAAAGLLAATRTQQHAHTAARAHSSTRAHAHAHKHTRTARTHARTSARTHARTHAQSRTHAHKRTQTHATTHSARTQTHTAGRACTRLRATCMHMRHAPAIKTALKKSSHACACACACMQFTYYIYMRAFLHERRADISAFAPAARHRCSRQRVVFACVGTSPKRAGQAVGDFTTGREICGVRARA